MKYRYFVTTIRIYHEGKYELHDCRCIGFYEKISSARWVILHNSLDEQGYYKYAVIEKFGPGWYPDVKLEEWYQYKYVGKKRKVIKIDKPKRFAQTCNYGIG